MTRMVTLFVILTTALVVAAAMPQPKPNTNSAPASDKIASHENLSRTTSEPTEYGTQLHPFVVQERESTQQRIDASKHATYESEEAANDRLISRFTIVLALAAVAQLLAASVQIYWMGRTVSDATLQHQISERAFAYLKKLEVRIERDELARPLYYDIEPIWTNSGHTPTRNALVDVNWTTQTTDLEDAFDYPFTAPSAVAFVGPAADVGSGLLRLPSSEVERILDKDIRIFIWGEIRYRDVFPRTNSHFSRFCKEMLVTTDAQQIARFVNFVSHGARNDSDDDDRRMRRVPRNVFDSWIANAVDILQRSRR